MSEHRIKYFSRRRYAHEPAWLSPIIGPGEDGAAIHPDVLRQIEEKAQFVIVCEVDDTPIYRDLYDRWVHWDPKADPTAPEGQQQLMR